MNFAGANFIEFCPGGKRLQQKAAGNFLDYIYVSQIPTAKKLEALLIIGLTVKLKRYVGISSFSFWECMVCLKFVVGSDELILQVFLCLESGSKQEL